MSHLLDRLTFFAQKKETFADGHGVTTAEARDWEDSYRKRWQHDKIVRSTHGVNCTGSCSWKIYVKGGIITWETQQTDYPRTRPELPNHEPRGCPRGASYSWYIYSAQRLKYPLIRKRLIKLWRAARKDALGSAPLPAVAAALAGHVAPLRLAVGILVPAAQKAADKFHETELHLRPPRRASSTAKLWGSRARRWRQRRSSDVRAPASRCPCDRSRPGNRSPRWRHRRCRGPRARSLQARRC